MALFFQTKDTGFCDVCGTVHSGQCPRDAQKQAEAVQ